MKILSTEVMTGISEGWAFICILLFLFGVAGIIVAAIGMADAELEVVVAGGIMLAMGFGLAIAIDADQSYKYEQHKAIITDFDEMHDDGYEIVEQEGVIFTIQKKGADEQ